MHKVIWKIGGLIAAIAASGLAKKGVEKLHDRFDPEMDPDDVKADGTADGEDAAADAADEEPETETGGADDDEP